MGVYTTYRYHFLPHHSPTDHRRSTPACSVGRLHYTIWFYDQYSIEMLSAMKSWYGILKKESQYWWPTVLTCCDWEKEGAIVAYSRWPTVFQFHWLESRRHSVFEWWKGGGVFWWWHSSVNSINLLVDYSWLFNIRILTWPDDVSCDCWLPVFCWPVTYSVFYWYYLHYSRYLFGPLLLTIVRR